MRVRWSTVTDRRLDGHGPDAGGCGAGHPDGLLDLGPGGLPVGTEPRQPRRHPLPRTPSGTCRWRSSPTTDRPTRGCATTRWAAASLLPHARRADALVSKGKPARQLALALRFLAQAPAAAAEGAQQGAGPVNDLAAATRPLATGLPQLPRDRLPRPLARHRPAAAASRPASSSTSSACGPAGRSRTSASPTRARDSLDARRRRGAADRDRLGVLRDSAPVAYQRIAGARVPVDEPLRARRQEQAAASRSPSATTSATTSWSSTRASSSRPSSAGPATRSAPASPSTPAATPTSRARRSRPTSRRRRAPSTAPARPATSPTSSSPS